MTNHKFRRQTTFNLHDTSYVLEGRHVIKNGVPDRMTLVVDYLHQALVVSSPVDVLKGLHKKGLTSYTDGDVRYAFQKLEELGITERIGNCLFRLADGGKARWLKMKSKL
jgi:repressor of nif and glnA expression